MECISPLQHGGLLDVLANSEETVGSDGDDSIYQRDPSDPSASSLRDPGGRLHFIVTPPN